MIKCEEKHTCKCKEYTKIKISTKSTKIILNSILASVNQNRILQNPENKDATLKSIQDSVNYLHQHLK